MNHKARSLVNNGMPGHASDMPADRSAVPLVTALVVAALALNIMLLLVSFAGIAQAAAPKLISSGNFGSVSPFPLGIAVDQSTSDVYVAGLYAGEPSKISKFDASGKLLAPSTFGEGFYSGAAVNPTDGNLYVVQTVLNEASETFEARVNTYEPGTGALLSSFPVPSSGNFLFGFLTDVEIATDSAGDVYIPVVPDNEVLEYNPTGALLRTFTGSGASALNGPIGVAVDSSGNLWVADAQNNRIAELSPSGAPVGEIKSEGVRAVALDTHGDVFAIVENGADFCGALEPPCAHLVEYSSGGAQLADIGAGSLGAPEHREEAGSMVAVNNSSGRVYVTDPAKNLVWIYEPPSVPTLGRELAAEVSPSEAKLGALVNPGGIETSYRFEYGTTTAYGQTAPFPNGNVGQGLAARTVWAAASGLTPGTTYHYRVIATSELGTVAGPDQTFTTETVAQVGCPNEQFRGGLSAGLPDCRAYELVTPPTKASTQPSPNKAENGLAASDGNRMSYGSIDIQPGTQTGGLQYLATRGASDWSSEDVIPLQSYTSDRCPFHDANMPAYSVDLARGVLMDGGDETSATSQLGGGCGIEAREVVSGEPLGVENLLLRDNTNSTYQLINTAPPGVKPANAHLQGASSDLSHVVFSESAKLTPEAPPIVAQNPILEVSQGSEDLYDWTGGVTRLVTVLPDGTPVAGSLAAGGARAVFDDGSILFTADGSLYMRVNAEQEQGAVAGGSCTSEALAEGKACTFQIDASQAGGTGGGGSLQDVAADGAQVLFTDNASADLTSDTVPGSGTNLYRYAGDQLTDLTPNGHAEVKSVSGASEDGSYVYFVADGALAPGASPGNCQVAEGKCNLYLSHEGTTMLVATLATGEGTGGENVRVSPNGAFLAFTSVKSLTGYDNNNASGFSVKEIFLYSAAANEISCASCNPSGEPPTADGARMEESSSGAPHYLSDSGRLFFDTAEGLLPLDTNGQTDVYEYEGDQLHLISAGTSSSESRIVDASASGDDVFFVTRQQLVPQDTEEEARNIYDARVDGGFPTPPSTPLCTTADACRTASSPQPAIFGAPSSETFTGAGNLAQPTETKPRAKPRSKAAKCKKGLVKKRSRCIKKLKRKTKRSAHANRTGK